MSPHALRQRMRHGNVYPPERAQVALDRFFTESNLTALRELSLRFVAGGSMPSSRGSQRAAAVQRVTERVLVLVDDSPATPRALRARRRPRRLLRAPLLARRRRDAG